MISNLHNDFFVGARERPSITVESCKIVLRYIALPKAISQSINLTVAELRGHFAIISARPPDWNRSRCKKKPDLAIGLPIKLNDVISRGRRVPLSILSARPRNRFRNLRGSNGDITRDRRASNCNQLWHHDKRLSRNSCVAGCVSDHCALP